MMVSKSLSIILAIVYSLFSVSLSGEDIGLPPSLTMRSIALVLLTICFCIVVMYEKDINLSLNKYINFLLLTLLLIISWILLSYLFSSNQKLVSIADIFAWITIPFCILLVFKISKYLLWKYFVYTIIIFQFFTILMIIMWTFINTGDITNSLIVREFIDENITIGLNRLLNGIALLNIFSISIVLGFYNSSKIIYILSFFNLICTFFLSFTSGSRQSVLAILSALFIIILINRYLRSSKGINYKSILFIFLFVFLVINVLQKEEIQTWIDDRFIAKTTEQLETGDKRTDIYELAIADLKDELLFGTGPGTYHKVSLIGLHTHNGYLYMANNFGVFSVILILLSFIFIIVNSLRKKTNIVANKKQDIFVTTFTTMLVFIFIMNMFNDLTTTLSFWMAVVLVIDSYSVRT
ncbi:O-antigen ligase family protein [Oceanobacillus picturae]|uniref:O-antigen ligase family protein n=1 Tax=Oceanobacillus picturae TaxID=171693 RepID=UPI00364428E7